MSSIKSVSLLSYVGSPTISGDNTLVNKSYVDTKFSTAATTSALGTVKPDGSTITVNNGVISAKISSVSGSFTLTSGALALNAASSTVLGGIKVGARLTMTNGVLSADEQTYTLPTASADTLGGVKVGSGLSISNGVLSVNSINTIDTQFVQLTMTNDADVQTALEALLTGNTITGATASDNLSSVTKGTIAFVTIKLQAGTAYNRAFILASAMRSTYGSWIELDVTPNTEVSSIGGASGAITLGSNLTMSGQQLSVTNLPAAATTAANSWTSSTSDTGFATPAQVAAYVSAKTVASVGGATGAITLGTGLGISSGQVSVSTAAETGSWTASTAGIATAKGVVAYVASLGYVTDSGITAITAGGSSVTVTDGTAAIPSASSSVYGVVKTTGAYSAADWTASSTSVVPTVDSVKDYIESLSYLTASGAVTSLGGKVGAVTVGVGLALGDDKILKVDTAGYSTGGLWGGSSGDYTSTSDKIATVGGVVVYVAGLGYLTSSTGVTSVGGQSGAITLGDTLAVSGSTLSVVTTKLASATKDNPGVVKVCLDYTASDWRSSGAYYHNVPSIDAVMQYVAAKLTEIRSFVTGRSKVVTITGDGTTTSFQVLHELGDDTLIVQVYDSLGNLVLADISIDDTDSCYVNFAEAPASGKRYNVVCHI